MRRLFLLQPMVWIMLFILCACQKEKKSNEENSPAIISKINLWLDAQKATANITKEKNIQLLKTSLEFSKIRFEKLSQNEQFLVVPILEEYRKTGKFDKNSILNLLLVVDELGNIKRGNISEIIPEINLQTDRLPSNTFYNLYNNRDLEIDGNFRFLSIAGKWQFQYGTKNGKLNSMGIVKPKANSSTMPINKINTCTEWYCVTTYFNSDGEIIDETWQYIGTTCTNGDCADPYNAMLCPDGAGGGGGGSGSGEEQETCCIVDPNVQFSSTKTNITRNDCGLEGVNLITGNATKTCLYSWTFDKWHLLWYNWDFTCVTKTDLEKEAGLWKFKSIAFQGVTRNGQLPPCVFSECIATYPNPSISANQLKAKLILTYTIQNRISCYEWWTPNNVTSTIAKDWDPPY